MPTTPPIINALPPAPNPDTDESVFDNAAYAYSAAQPGFVTQANALGANVYANAQEAASSAAAASGSAGAAATQAGLATTNGQTQVALAVAQVAIATAKATQATNDAQATAADRVQTGLDRVAAAASAASAAAVAGAFVGTSPTSVVCGTGIKNFMTQTGEQYTPNVFMTSVSAANANIVMFGQAVSYNSSTGALQMNVSYASGAGTTAADWNLSLSGPQGATGPQGIPGAGVTPQVIGFTMTGGTTTPKTLTVDETTSVTALLAAIAAAANMTRVPRTSNIALVAADSGKWFDASGTFAQTIATAGLPNGWNCIYRNIDVGDITIATDDEKLLPINGDFSQGGLGWQGSGAWAFSGNVATLTSSNIGLNPNTLPLVVGRAYKITATVNSISGGTLFLRTNGGTISTSITAPGTYTLNVPSATVGSFEFVPNTIMNCVISNVVVQDLSPFIMYPGEMRRLQWDGTSLRSIVLNSFSKKITASVNFIRPPGYKKFDGLIWNGGNGGYRGTGQISGAAGGACFPFSIDATTMPQVTAMTVGAGGAGSVTSNSNGANGGISLVGTLIIMAANKNGETPSSYNGATAIGSVVNSTGFETILNSNNAVAPAVTWGGGCGANPLYSNAATCTYGGAGGGGMDGSSNITLPGNSKFGGQGGAASVATKGGDGTAPGGGGGGSRIQGGDGARGEIRIYGVI